MQIPAPSATATGFTGSLADRFQEICGRHGSSTALISPTQSLTYTELDHLSTAIACTICNTPIQGESAPIIIVAEHEWPGIAALLGVLKAGAFFIPLDPRDPLKQVQEIMKRVSPAAILSDEINLPRLTNLAFEMGIPIRSIETSAREPTDNADLPTRIDPDSTACIYFTSGSTGLSKGVIHTHRTLMNWAQTDVERLGFDPADHFALLFHVNFSASRIAIFGSLLNGGALHMYDLKAQGLGDLFPWLEAEGVTVLSTFPSLYREAARSASTDPLKSLRLIHIAGEASKPEDLQLLHQVGNENSMLCVQLGSTEAGPIAELLLDRSSKLDNDMRSVGQVVQDKKVVIIDEIGDPVPEGEIGEIQIRSPFLSIGYWGEKALTAASFHSFQGETAFNTGDIGRIMPDGSLQFLGRRDNQIKIRGYRVNLDAVESALCENDNVAKAAVMASEDEWGKTHLVAYYVPTQKEETGVMEFRRQLLKKLPDYMIPMAFIAQESLPRTNTGKIDRKALPVPDHKWLQFRESYVAPSTRIERSLVKLWEKVLKVSPIGVRDQFIELGGESLDAMRLLAEVKTKFGVEIEIDDFFDAGSVEKQASLLKAQPVRSPKPSLVPIQTGGSRPTLYCMHPLGGLVNIYDRLATFLGPDQPVYGLRAQGLSGKVRPLARVEAMAERYVSEIQKHQPQGPYILCGFSFGGVLAYEVGRQLTEAGLFEVFIIMIDAKLRFTQHKKDEYLQRRAKKHQTAREEFLAGLKDAGTMLRDGQTLEALFASARLLRQRLGHSLAQARRRFAIRNPERAKSLNAQKRVKFAIIKANARYKPVPFRCNHVYYIKASKTEVEVLDLWVRVKPDLKMIEIKGGHKDLLRGERIDEVASEISKIVEKVCIGSL